MQAIIEATSQITVDITKDFVTLKGTDLHLGISENINDNDFFDEKGYPNKQGYEMLTTAFLAGLNGNIHIAHQQGYRDSAEHLRYIIAQLEEMFILIPTIEYAEKEVENA